MGLSLRLQLREKKKRKLSTEGKKAFKLKYQFVEGQCLETLQLHSLFTFPVLSILQEINELTSGDLFVMLLFFYDLSHIKALWVRINDKMNV